MEEWYGRYLDIYDQGAGYPYDVTESELLELQRRYGFHYAMLPVGAGGVVSGTGILRGLGSLSKLRKASPNIPLTSTVRSGLRHLADTDANRGATACEITAYRPSRTWLIMLQEDAWETQGPN